MTEKPKKRTYHRLRARSRKARAMRAGAHLVELDESLLAVARSDLRRGTAPPSADPAAILDAAQGDDTQMWSNSCPDATNG